MTPCMGLSTQIDKVLSPWLGAKKLPMVAHIVAFKMKHVSAGYKHDMFLEFGRSSASRSLHQSRGRQVKVVARLITESGHLDLHHNLLDWSTHSKRTA